MDRCVGMAKKLIVLEGLDGSGKSTQVEKLKEHLIKDGVSLKQIKLPDYEDPSSTLVRMYLSGEFGSHPQDVNVFAASAFYAVDRYASFKRHWKADYENGMLILADRYTTSNAVHQTVKLPKENWKQYLSWLSDFEYVKMGIPKPDLVIFLDMPVDVSQKLMSARYGGNEQKKDVHEADVSYLKSCHEAAMFAAKELSWHVVPCSDGEKPYSIESIHDAIYKIVKKELF